MNWVYLSSLLTICVYFKFSRFWSVRNLDLVGLLLFAPGLVLVAYGKASPLPSDEQIAIGQFGYVWLFTIGGLFLIRMLMDSLMVRRPLLEPNLSVGGMTFLGVALLVFLMANIANSDPKELEPLPREIAANTDVIEEKENNEDAAETASASAALKKQEGTYEDIYFKYGLNYDLRNSSYRPSSGNRTSFYQELPIVSGNNEISNTFVFTQYKTLN